MFCAARRLLRATLALILVSPVVYVCAQAPPTTVRPYDPSPFNLIGTISAMSCNETSDPLAGGTITVDGMVITVPKNLLVTLPSINVAWPELFDDANETPNLPLLDSVSWEATIFGNIVQGQPIAGLIYLTQESTQLLQGFITSIDYDTGHFFVNNEIEAVLNDPLGQYGLAFADYPLWTVDAQNPSVTASTGFPLCIPRNSTDADCPLTNRPVDGDGFYLTSFTFGDPATVAPGDPDPRLMAPLVVGDYITFSGVKVPGGLLAIYSLSANLGIYTAAGTKPAYVSPATATYAIQVPDATLEAGETRATAFVTDASTTLEWYAIDVDPCTGEETERNLLLAQPAGAAPIGRTTFRTNGGGARRRHLEERKGGGGGGGVSIDVGDPTREMGFRYSTGTSAGPKGLIAGQYIQPVFFFVFPELISFGLNEVPNQFDMFPFLAMGSGPYTPGNYLADSLEAPPIVGQLSPWPGVTVPGTTACSASTAATAKPS